MQDIRDSLGNVSLRIYRDEIRDTNGNITHRIMGSDIKLRWKDCFCLGFRLSPQFADEKMQIIKLYYNDDQLRAHKYTGEDYQFILSEFMEEKNYRKCLQDVINQYKGKKL